MFLAPLDVALDSLSASVGNDAQRRAYVRARRTEHAFVSDKPLQHQRPEIADALRALTNLAARLHGATPLFEVAPHDFASAPETFAERVRTAERRVGELGRERDWTAAGTAATRALDAFADALEVAPVSLSAPRWSAAVTKVRYAALELEREGDISVQRSTHIKAGLLAAIGGIEQLADPGPRMYEISIKAARAAAKAIDPGTSFVFQRGVIQEAFRATANAYLSIGLAPRSREATPQLSRRSR